MSEHFSSELIVGIRYIISIIRNFALYPFPGTNVPVIGIMIGVWGVYFIWRWFVSQLFDIEVKK